MLSILASVIRGRRIVAVTASPPVRIDAAIPSGIRRLHVRFNEPGPAKPRDDIDIECDLGRT
jgi:hypothetical protein